MISYDIESNDSDTDLLIVNKIKEQYRLQVGDSIEFTSKNTYKDKWDDEMSYSLKNNSIDFTPPPMSSLIMLPVNYISDGKILTLSIDYSKNGERIIFENMGVDFSKASIDKVIIYYSFTKL